MADDSSDASGADEPSLWTKIKLFGSAWVDNTTAAIAAPFGGTGTHLVVTTTANAVSDAGQTVTDAQVSEANAAEDASIDLGKGASNIAKTAGEAAAPIIDPLRNIFIGVVVVAIAGVLLVYAPELKVLLKRVTK